MNNYFAMADLAGLTRETLDQVMSAGPSKPGILDFIKAYLEDGEMQLAFSVANAGRDVGYYGKVADDFGVTSLMCGAVKNVPVVVRAQDLGDHLVPEMVERLVELLKK